MALDITYAAWAVLFTIIILKDYSLINPRTIICTLTVIISAIFAATDLLIMAKDGVLKIFKKIKK